MNSGTDWQSVWEELQINISNQPKCPKHPEYPCVKTLVQGVINDIIQVNKDGITVRSHRTNREDFIERDIFGDWWQHLITKKTASLRPGHSENPNRWRSCIVGAILCTCLPEKIKKVNNNSISHTM